MTVKVILFYQYKSTKIKVMINLFRNLLKFNRRPKKGLHNEIISFSALTYDKISYWRNKQKGSVIRSSFNEELYYKYLKAIKND